jgi:hypothetical protein
VGARYKLNKKSEETGKRAVKRELPVSLLFLSRDKVVIIQIYTNIGNFAVMNMSSYNILEEKNLIHLFRNRQELAHASRKEKSL